jgi:CheY-like chemotaxis protein
MSSKILLADNSPTVRNVTLSLLKKHGYQVFSAQDGVEALKKAKADRPDVIFLDESITILDGEQVLRELKRDQDLKDVPVVMILSRNEPERKEQLRQLGSEFFIPKPVNPVQILDSVEIFLSKQKVPLSQAENSYPHDAPSEQVSTSGEVEQAQVALSEGEAKAEGALNIVNTSDFIHELGTAPHVPDEEANHGFEWFLSELKQEALEGESLTPQIGNKSSSSRQKKTSEPSGDAKENHSSEHVVGERGFEEFVKELKHNLYDAGAYKKPKMESASIENIHSSHFDQLISALVQRIPQRVAQEVAGKVSSELLEKIIREELSKVKTGST